MRKRFIAGNWKMYKFISSSMEFADEFKELYIPNDNTTVALICPYLQIPALKYALQDTSIFVGAQNMHYETEGAFTGEISGEMLKEVGTDFVIIGHSERRQYFGETDEAVNAKIKKALMLEIYPILCVGESLEQREVGLEKITVKEELEKGTIGDVCYMETEFLTSFYNDSNIRTKKEMYGGALYDLGCYCTTMILTMMEELPE